MKITDTPKGFNDKIAIDIVGPLQESIKGNKYILTLQDQLTKFIQAYPLKDQTAKTVIKSLASSYFSMFGIPKVILSDRGNNFTSNVMKELCELFDIRTNRNYSVPSGK